MNDREWTSLDFVMLAVYLVGMAFICWYAYRNRTARPVNAKEIPDLREKALLLIDGSGSYTKDADKAQVSKESNVEVLRIFVATEGNLSLFDAKSIALSLRESRLSFTTNLRAVDITVEHAEAYKKISDFQVKDTADNATLSQYQLGQKTLLQREFLAYGLANLDQVDAMLRILKEQRIYDLDTLKGLLKKELA